MTTAVKMEIVNLSDGNKIPMVGLGTWLASDEEELMQALDHALEAGYRHFDTAFVYKNEAILGKVFKKWFETGKVTREEIFVVTKLPIFGNSTQMAGIFLQKSLDALQLDYVDLYLIHVPFGAKFSANNAFGCEMENEQTVFESTTTLEELWKVMEGFVKQGKTKSIGISNCDESQVERIVKVAKIQPSCLQVEMHGYLQQKSLRTLCAKHNIVVCAYSPLGSPGRRNFYDMIGVQYEPVGILENPTVIEIASMYDKSPAQILLRLLIHQGVVIIPKSTNLQRLKENLEVLDFELNPKDIKALEGLDKGDAGRTLTFADWMPGIDKHPEFPENMKRTLKLREKHGNNNISM